MAVLPSPSSPLALFLSLFPSPCPSCSHLLCPIPLKAGFCTKSAPEVERKERLIPQFPKESWWPGGLCWQGPGDQGITGTRDGCPSACRVYPSHLGYGSHPFRGHLALWTSLFFSPYFLFFIFFFLLVASIETLH